MSDITWQFQFSIPGGPALLITQPNITVGAYDVASTTIAVGASNIDVAVQPSSTAGDVVFVVVSSDFYDPGLTYIIDGGAPPKTLTFSNTAGSAAKIQVVAGRKNP